MYTLQTIVNADVAGTENEGLRVLSLEELDQVSGAFSYRELGGWMLSGAVTGGMAGWMAGPGAIGAGALAGALIGGAGYVTYEFYASF
jgi:ABC-type uncharacterized transport system permease subunit